MTVTFEFNDALEFARAFHRGMTAKGWEPEYDDGTVTFDMRDNDQLLAKLDELRRDVAVWCDENERDWDVSVFRR